MATQQYEYIELSGVIVPDTEETLATVQNEFKNAFGQDLVVTSDTPQGVLISDETIARDTVIQNNAALANQINPNLSGGVFLDALWALTGGQRAVATKSYLTAELAGVPGTVIPEGVTAKLSTTGSIWASSSSVTLAGDGTAAVEFQSVDTGPIAAPANTLTVIENGVLGWETINNPDAAILGSDTQSDNELRLLRFNTLALQGTALPEAIRSALYITDGVRSLTFRENVTDTTQVIDDVTLVPHSIYVCVDGGTDQDVASVLLSKKSAGSNWNGGTTVNVIDPVSGQTYPVKFDRPALVLIVVRAYVKVGVTVSDPVALTKQAILAYSNNEIPGEPGLVVGQSVSPFELAGAINIQNPGIYVQKIEISFIDPLDFVVEELPIEIFQKAYITEDSISVTVL